MSYLLSLSDAVESQLRSLTRDENLFVRTTLCAFAKAAAQVPKLESRQGREFCFGGYRLVFDLDAEVRRIHVHQLSRRAPRTQPSAPPATLGY